MEWSPACLLRSISYQTIKVLRQGRSQPPPCVLMCECGSHNIDELIPSRSLQENGGEWSPACLPRSISYQTNKVLRQGRRQTATP
jgi:hypothetical protein